MRGGWGQPRSPQTLRRRRDGTAASRGTRLARPGRRVRRGPAGDATAGLAPACCTTPSSSLGLARPSRQAGRSRFVSSHPDQPHTTDALAVAGGVRGMPLVANHAGLGASPRGTGQQAVRPRRSPPGPDRAGPGDPPLCRAGEAAHVGEAAGRRRAAEHPRYTIISVFLTAQPRHGRSTGRSANSFRGSRRAHGGNTLLASRCWNAVSPAGGRHLVASLLLLPAGMGG